MPSPILVIRGFLRLELGRSFRDLRYIVLAIAAPVGFYLLFAGIFSGQETGPGQLPASVEIMVAMAAFGAMWGALSATAPRLARDRESGWLKALEATPARPSSVLIARILAGLIVALPAIVAVGVTGAIAHNVTLHLWQWIGILGLLWIGTLPFVALGTAIGSLTNSTTAYALTTALYFALAALGGLWVPPEQFSAGLRHVAQVLPSYNLAAPGWSVAEGSAPSIRAALTLVMWTVGFGLLALLGSAHRIGRHHQGGSPACEPESAICLNQIVKNYGSVQAVSFLDLVIGRGSSVAILGPNGAGKSTLIEVLLGVLEPSAGSVSLSGAPPAAALRMGRVGAMLQDTELMAGVRVGRLLSVIRGLYPSPTDMTTLIEVAGVGDLMRRRTDQLSVGQAQRVRFALAASGDPQLIVLDEPTAAMDVQARNAFWQAIESYAESGKTILFSTHYLEEADDNADRIVVLRSGHIVADGTPAQIKAAGGQVRTVRFRLTSGSVSSFRDLTAVTGVRTDGDWVTLQTSDSDATIWALYGMRDSIAEIEVTNAGGIQEAFLALTSGN